MQIATANSYYRSNFFSRRVSDFMRIAISDSMIFANPDKNFQNWQNSLHAAYAAKLLNDEITYLTQQIAWLTAQVEQAKAAEAAEQAQLLAQAQTLRAANTFRVSALPVGAQLSTTAGSIALTAGSSLTLDTAIQAAIQALRGLAATVLDRATGVGIGLLLYSPALGNSDLYPTAMSIPAAGLAPQLPGNLPEIAAAGGTVDMPYRIYGDRTQYSLIATPVGDRAAAKVPVRALTLDPSLNAYTFTSADTPPRTLVFPIAAPGNSSTTSPTQPMDVPVYSGVTLTPTTATTEVLPAVDPLDIRDAIYVFPAGSGIAPVYLVFSESLDAGRFTRKQLDKKYLKHASDFGIDDTRKNSATLTKFRDAINRHLEHQETVPKGTYLLADGSSVYFNPKTNNVVILDKNGNFLSGWKIEPGTQQFINYVEKGNLR